MGNQKIIIYRKTSYDRSETLILQKFADFRMCSYLRPLLCSLTLILKSQAQPHAAALVILRLKLKNIKVVADTNTCGNLQTFAESEFQTGHTKFYGK